MLLLVRAVRTFSMRLENEEHEQCASQLLECERSLRSDRRSSVRRSGRGSVRAATGAGGARGSVRAPTAAIVLSDEQLLRVRPALVTLWSDASVQLAFRHRSLFHLVRTHAHSVNMFLTVHEVQYILHACFPFIRLHSCFAFILFLTFN